MAGHRVVHFELPADNAPELVKFYTSLFGWQIEKANLPGPEYWFCRTGDGPGIDGAIMQRVHPQQPITNYVLVDSVDAYIAKAVQLGARVGVEKTPVANMGAFAILFDPQGNPMGLWEMAAGAG